MNRAKILWALAAVFAAGGMIVIGQQTNQPGISELDAKLKVYMSNAVARAAATNAQAANVAPTKAPDTAMDFLSELRGYDIDRLLTHPEEILFARDGTFAAHKELSATASEIWKKHNRDKMRALDYVLEQALAQPGVDLTKFHALQRLFIQMGKTNQSAILDLDTNAGSEGYRRPGHQLELINNPNTTFGVFASENLNTWTYQTNLVTDKYGYGTVSFSDVTNDAPFFRLSWTKRDGTVSFSDVSNGTPLFRLTWTNGP